ncbi:MAG TPA: SDR family oxidoreductase [Caulobacteraceae bacterium]|jgi:NAD(P)-dependent dehydrogenase (short-subunit alcohol dehydrogenase family)|nr:SDR family oxidoreductase [Caulobacteraceae bacterium]
MDLTDKRVVVIGGSSGIGYAVAEGALAQGAEVIIGSSQAANVETSTAKLGNRASGHAVNVREEPSVEAFFEAVGAFDHLVFTAGDWAMAGLSRPRGLDDLVNAPNAFAVRYWGALAAVKYGAKLIREGGSITLTNGTIAHNPRKGTALSTAMAGSLEFLGRGLAVDLAPIRVNVVCPGGVRTGIWDGIPSETREAQFERMFARQPLPRIGEPAEVAEAYLYLMRAGYTTGQVLVVDGGGSIA